MRASEDVGALRLELRTRNNRLWHVIYDRWGSVRAFCDEFGLCQSDVGRFLNLKDSPWNKKTGELKKTPQRIVDVTGRHVLWLFDADLYDQDVIPARILVAEVDQRLVLPESAAANVLALGPAPDDAPDDGLSVNDLLHNALGTLTPREEDVVRRRFGLEPYDRAQPLEAIAEAFDVTRERVRQIEGKALRKLRGPLRGGPLRRALRGEDPFLEAVDLDEIEAAAASRAYRRIARDVADRATRPGPDYPMVTIEAEVVDEPEPPQPSSWRPPPPRVKPPPLTRRPGGQAALREAVEGLYNLALETKLPA